MTRRDKVIQKIKDGRSISYEEAETLLISYGFKMRSARDHTTFFLKMDMRKIYQSKNALNCCHINCG